MRSDLPTSPPEATYGKGYGPGRRKWRRPPRWTTGSVAPVALALVASGFAYAALQDRSALSDIEVASTFLPAGAPVDARDTRTVAVHASDQALLAGMATTSLMASPWVAAVPLRAGEPITASELVRPVRGAVLGQMSIPVPIEQAAGGRINVGDSVDVIASSPDGAARYVAQALHVLAVAPGEATGSVLGGGTGSYYIVVGVSKTSALQVASALAGATNGTAGQIDVVRSTGEAPTAVVAYRPTAATVASGPAEP